MDAANSRHRAVQQSHSECLIWDLSKFGVQLSNVQMLSQVLLEHVDACETLLRGWAQQTG